jgi:signal transduction histidine kinase
VTDREKGLVTVIEDITAGIEAEASLKEALNRAEEADRIKSTFLATMSHELRTPLNSIIGFTGILLQSLAGPLNPEQRKQLGMVQNSSRHLLALINDVLDLSKIGAI